MNCKNFICYRGSSSIGLSIAKNLMKAMKPFMREVTYYSNDDTDKEAKNFLTDPKKYLGSIEYFIIILTKDFFSGFMESDSVTRLELFELFNNPNAQILKIELPDFHWDNKLDGLSNREIVSKLFGKSSMERIVGALPKIPYIDLYEETVYKTVIEKICHQEESRKKIVVFDFDGTLTKPSPERKNTWERIWLSLGLSLDKCYHYHSQFSAGKISHQEWCEITENIFKAQGCSKNHITKVANEIVLLNDVSEVILKLKSMGFLLYILSGSVREVIQSVLGKELTKCFVEIKANRFHFDDEGLLTGITGTPYDFEHKAAFVSRVIIEKKTKPSEILFVGNSFNDEFVYTTGVETLCINPKDTKLYAHDIWNNYIRQCDSLKDILPYCGVKVDIQNRKEGNLNMNSNKYDVFISHSSEDKQYIEKMRKCLEEVNIKCWVSYRDIPPGSSYAVVVPKAIKETETFLLVISANSVKSSQVRDEIAAAIEEKKRIIPYKITDIELDEEMKLWLRRRQITDASKLCQLEYLKGCLSKEISEKPVENQTIHQNFHDDTQPEFILISGFQVKESDIKQALELDYLVYDIDESVHFTLEKCIAWHKINPDIYFMFKLSNQEKIVGYINVAPVTDEGYEKIKSGQIWDIDITEDYVLPYEFPGTYYLYFSSIVIHPDYRNAGLVKRFIDAFVAKIIELYNNEIYFSAIVGDAITPEGEKFGILFGMKKITESDHKSKIYEVSLMPPKFNKSSKALAKLYELYERHEREEYNGRI